MEKETILFHLKFQFQQREGIWKYLIKVFSVRWIWSVDLILSVTVWAGHEELYSNVNYWSHQDWLGYWKLLMDWFWDDDGATRGGNNGTTNTKDHSVTPTKYNSPQLDKSWTKPSRITHMWWWRGNCGVSRPRVRDESNEAKVDYWKIAEDNPSLAAIAGGARLVVL